MQTISVGILLDGNSTLPWVQLAIQSIRALPGVDVVVYPTPDSASRLGNSLQAPRDVFLCLGTNYPNDPFLSSARWGLWRIGHGKDFFIDEHLQGFSELFAGEDVLVSRLVQYGPQPGQIKILYESAGPVIPTSLSETLAHGYWKGSQFFARKLREIIRFGRLESQAAPSSSVRGRLGFSARFLLGLLGIKLFFRKGLRRLRDIFVRDQWCLAQVPSSANHPARIDWSRARWLVPPKDRFWADPFLAEAAGKTYLFFEECRFDDFRGYLMAGEWAEDGTLKTPQMILKENHHLAYPFVFEWKGEWYLIPDAAQSGAITLYRARSFPFQWEKLKDLMTGVRASDTTLVEWEGRWWMFTSLAAGKALNYDELFVFYSETPLGPWTPHTQNPVKSDVRSSRPAGRLWVSEGRLYRPAQDCSRRYGWRVSVQKIERLTPDVYQETEIGRIGPEAPGLVGVHTLNQGSGRLVWDALRRRSKHF